jgi:hypothetical protein
MLVQACNLPYSGRTGTVAMDHAARVASVLVQSAIYDMGRRD